MSSPFSRTLRSLEADGFRGSLLGVVAAGVLLFAWLAWFFGDRVTLFALSDTARLEVDRAAHPVAAPVDGRVLVNHLAVGREVAAGDVLVELEPDAERLRLLEEQSRLGALAPQVEALRRELSAAAQAQADEGRAAHWALAEARARLREAQVLSHLAGEEAERLGRLSASGLASEMDLSRVQAEARRREAAVDALRLGCDRLASEGQARESERRARVESLRREVTRLEGERNTAVASGQRLSHELERRRIRAPISGRVGEAPDVPTGGVVKEGDRLGTIVPSGTLRIVAYFASAAALGRVRPGQTAWLRLDGFPWTQYGSVSASVQSVGSEVRDGRLRVELTVRAFPPAPLPLQHGLTGQVEVEVERLSPAALAWRTAGGWAAAPAGRLSRP